jgi:hypothetical protein
MDRKGISDGWEGRIQVVEEEERRRKKEEMHKVGDDGLAGSGWG